MNAVIKSEHRLDETNYILQPSPRNHYWANISAGRLDEFRSRCGDSFNIVIVGLKTAEGDFYAIPYVVLKQALTSAFQSVDKTGRVRWVAQIKHHQLKIGRYPLRIDVGAYFGRYDLLVKPRVDDLSLDSDSNEYAIENRKVEIEQRQKQSVFRRQVLENFGNRCCLSRISESELLVASHIVPWSQRIETRLDPANGLLLNSLYDRLFDKGLISLNDDLTVVVVPWFERLSSPLRTILHELAFQRASSPLKWAIKPEYLSYHRTVVFRTTPP